MTISSETNRISYTGNGSTVDFSFPYYFLANADLKVIKKTIATGAEATLTLTTDYTITGAGVAAGGTVTLNSAPSTAFKITIYRDPAKTQGLDLVENDDMPAEAIEQAFDRLTMIAQRNADLTSRSLKLSDGIPAGAFDLTLPANLTDSANIGASVIVNATGDGLALGPNTVSPTNEAIHASAFWRGIVYLTSADSPYTPSQNQNGYLLSVDSSGGAVVVNLPSIAAMFAPFNIGVLLRVAGNSLTVNRNGTDLINGSTSKSTSTAGVGFQLVASTGLAPDDWGSLDFGTVADLAIVVGKLSLTLLNSLTTVTPVAADFVAGADTSDSSYNKKFAVADLRNAVYRSVTTTDAVGADDETMKLSGASFTSTLPTAVGCAGKRYKFLHAGTSLTQLYTLATTSSQTIGGYASGAIILYTAGEALEIESDGANWVIVNHFTSIGPVAYTPAFGAGFGTVTNASAHWTRRGAYLKVIGTCNPPGSGVGSAPYSISLPSGLSLKTSGLSISGNALDAAGCIVGEGTQNSNSSNSRIATAPGTDTAKVYLCPNFSSSSGNIPTSATTLIDNNGTFSFYFEVPISQWVA